MKDFSDFEKYVADQRAVRLNRLSNLIGGLDSSTFRNIQAYVQDTCFEMIRMYHEWLKQS